MQLQSFTRFATATILFSIVASCSAQQPEATRSDPSPTPEATVEVSTNPSSSAPQADGEQIVADNSATSDCNNAQTQAEMTFCAEERAKQADDKLNQVYQKLRDEIKGSPQEQRLIDAQLAWIQFRDKDCEYAQRQFDGGSMMSMVYSECLASATEQRTQQLGNYLEVAEQ